MSNNQTEIPRRRQTNRYSLGGGLAKSLVTLIAVLMPWLCFGDTTTKVQLLLSADTVRPGDTITAGISLTMQPSWNSYWRNGGDSGLPTEVVWKLPAGVTAGGLQWPIPEKVVTQGLITYDYYGEAVLITQLKIGPDVAPGPLELKAEVSWQECQKLCIQGHTSVTAPLTVGNQTIPSADGPVLDSVRAKLPATGTNPPVHARWEGADDPRSLVIELESTENVAVMDFFPYSSPDYEVKGETAKLAGLPGKIRIQKQVSKSGSDWPDHVAGILITKASADASARGWEVNLAIGSLMPAPAPTSAIATAAPPAASLIVMLGVAFLGGLILNIMPCVLPVIALKVLSFVNQSRAEPGRVRKLGLIYGLGVSASFLALAGVAVAVQHAGGQASWSSAFQNPQFRVILTVLITLVALNLFGVFEVALGGKTMGAASDLTAKEGASGAFFNGVLATVLATPCTAPYLASAIGFAFTQPPAIVALIFLMVGFGLAAPFVLLCWNPGWLRYLPRPGLWMQQFKVAMGFPMLATAAWLFWLTATRMGRYGVLDLGLFLVVIAFAAWIWGEFVQRTTKRAGLAMIVSGLLIASGYGFFLENELHWRQPPGSVKETMDWQTWSTEAVAKARAEGHPVLVDFTADTCLNCKINKRFSIDIKSTREKLKQINATVFEADYTDQDPVIARELKHFGRAGVPLVLVYPADKSRDPIVLPDGIFSAGQMLDALDKATRGIN